MKVLKFGGTSLANSRTIKLVKDIALKDKKNKFIVVSAPGKQTQEDTKVTDLLYAGYSSYKRGTNFDTAFLPVKMRFKGIVDDLKLKVNLEPDFLDFKKRLEKGAGEDFVASRGECFSSKICAVYFGLEFVDAADIIKFDACGKFLSEDTNAAVKKRLAKSNGAVIGGFYGAKPNGDIKTFSRGGSDITGAIIARAVGASVYENWTDVDGFMVCDPRVVKNPPIIQMVTYKELRELSYMGASVLHSDSIFPVRKSDIPIHIRNTFNPASTGTMVVPTKKYVSGEFSRKERLITGIAGKKKISAIYLEKSMMNDEVGFARKVLSVLEKHSISLEQMPSGIDTLTVLFDCNNIQDAVIKKAFDDIKTECNPDNIQLVRDLSLVAVVGHGMSKRKGTAARLCGALSKADINIRLIDQGSSELNIIVGIDAKDYDKALNALFDEFKND